MEMRLEHVYKTLRRTEVIHDVSLSMTGGQVYGLRGYNGSGKTMLMRVMAGLMKPTDGQVYIGGKKLGEEMDFPPSIGILLENPAFLADYTGFENLELIAGLRQVAGREQIREALARVGLDPDDRRKYRKYSLGMKQRLGVAGAVFEHPDIVLLDEPTNALDAEGVERVTGLIRTERDRGALVVVASHGSGWLDGVADKIFVIENGRIPDNRKQGDYDKI